MLDDTRIPTLVARLDALASEPRVRLLRAVAATGGHAHSSALGAMAGLEHGVAAHHLMVLVRAGLVARRQHGRFSFYELAGPASDELIRDLTTLFQGAQT